MEIKQEQHLQRIKDEFTSLVDAKYRAGQKEHGGTLLEKEGLLDMGIEEVLDLAVYLLTLKEQLNEKTINNSKA